ILLLNKCWNTFGRGCLKNGATCVTSYTYSDIRLKFINDTTSFIHTFYQFCSNTDIFNHILPVEPCNRKTYNPVSGSGYTFHFHAILCSHKQYFTIGPTLSDCICYRYSRKNMSSCSATTYYKLLHT